MNRYINILFALLFCLVVVESSAQSISSGANIYGAGVYAPEKPDLNSIEGTRFLHDYFTIGDVYFGDRFRTPQIPLRLNINTDELEFIEDSVIKVYENPKLIDKVVMGDEIFICLSNPRFKTRKKGFVKMWNLSYPSVITKMRVNCYKYSVEAFSETKPTRFKREKDVHYLIVSEELIVLIPTVQKLIDMLGDHTEELEKFAESENISVDNGADLSRLVDYYHQLSGQDL